MEEFAIALFVYNRPIHTEKVLKSLIECNKSNNYDLIIFSDGAKNKESESEVLKVREICEKANGFKSIKLIKREKNIGLAQNIITGLNNAFSNYSQITVIEDDIKVSKGFLEYITAALEFYKNKNVLSISGYTPNIKIPQNYKNSTYIIKRNCSWGWATWKEKWEIIDWQVSDFKDFIRDKNKIKKFNECGDDLTPMLLKQQIGQINSWSIRFCYSGFCNNLPTVYPTKSLVENIGTDGSGTNVRNTKKYRTFSVENIDLQNFTDNIEQNSEILKTFRKTYNTSLFRKTINLIKRIKYLLTNKTKKEL
ncbi:MAG: glycosyltransferase [Bacteroidales bacterium]|nr:glycosyltransferase [Bacteroidales bacterium]